MCRGLQDIRRLILGIFILGLGLGAGLAVTGFLISAFVPRGAGATHDSSGNIHACVSLYTGQTRVMLPGRPPNCNSSEMLVEWAGPEVAGDISDLVARVDALKTDNATQQGQIDGLASDQADLEAQVPDCLSEEGGNADFTGCNVQIMNGLGSTEVVTNGTANLIVGYNENMNAYERTGSHNIVVGPDHGYTSYGGFVSGRSNQISGAYTTISGGFGNSASGSHAVVSGGGFNSATGFDSSVSGGLSNEASGQHSTVTGGNANTASGKYSSVSGGFLNKATGEKSSVSGGDTNTASGTSSSVSGGFFRSATGANDWVAGTLFQDQ